MPARPPLPLPPPLIVFSDLDGTLLDHETYDWAPAAPALDRLRDVGAWVVLASSKTAAEMAPLRRAIGFAHCPAIVENGAGVLPPGADTAPGQDYAALRAVLAGLPPGFRGFGDMTAAQVSGLTGLTAAAAARAKDRRFSEPGLWTGPAAAQADFAAAAQAAGLCLQQGGRFLSLSYGATKADRVAEIIAAEVPLHTLALGDAPNDAAMLRTADHAVIVRNAAAPPMPDLPPETTRRTTRPGPDGWADAVMAHLDRLAISGDTGGHG